MLKAVINLEGKTYSDLELALSEVLKQVRNETRSGMDSNDSGEYDFSISGEEESDIEFTLTPVKNNRYKLEFEGEKFFVRSYTDVDPDETGVEIYDDKNKKLLWTMQGEEISEDYDTPIQKLILRIKEELI